MRENYNETIKNLQTIYGVPMTVRLTIEALEKQIPKKPVKKYFGYFLDFLDTCPYCEHVYNTNEKYSYCPNCGQKLDWSGENDI